MSSASPLKRLNTFKYNSYIAVGNVSEKNISTVSLRYLIILITLSPKIALAPSDTKLNPFSTRLPIKDLAF
jgi:hypothetical protein